MISNRTERENKLGFVRHVLDKEFIKVITTSLPHWCSSDVPELASARPAVGFPGWQIDGLIHPAFIAHCNDNKKRRMK